MMVQTPVEISPEMGGLGCLSGDFSFHFSGIYLLFIEQRLVAQQQRMTRFCH